MAHSFIAYIDEAGDDGLNPEKYRVVGRRGGSSHWLTIGASVWRLSRDLDAVGWGKAILGRLPHQQSRRALHFKDMEHPARVMAIGELAERPIRCLAVIANKPIIPAGMYADKNQLYHYMCRYLIERLSWLCRDMRPHVPEGDGRVKIIFSRRRAMNYTDFQGYVQRLRDMEAGDIRIHWPVIDIGGIEAHDHPNRMGLQIADLVTSGLTAALEPDLFGNVESRYARMLKPRVYNRNGNYMSYGTKMVPSADQLDLTNQQREFIDLFG